MSRWYRIIRNRARAVWRGHELDAELSREFSFHFEQLVRENTEAGMTPEDAHAAALRALGNVTLLQEKARDQRRVNWIHDLQRDLAYGARMLRKSPGFTAIAALSLALGIGANTAVLGGIENVLIEALPFPDAGRLVVIRTMPLDNPAALNNNAVPDFLAWQEQSRSFEGMGASLSNQQDFGSDSDGHPAERIAGQAFTTSLFRTLGRQPLLGRVFNAGEDEIEHPARVIVLSYELWQDRFAGDPDIVGRKIRMNGATNEIIGVMPPDFHHVQERAKYWIPLAINRSQLQGSARYFIVMGRLKPGVSIGQAQAELDALAARRAADFPDTNKGWGVHVQPLREFLFGWSLEPLMTLEGAVALVLLIACANVAGLLLARNSARRPEIAMRIALGASRGRIFRQFFAESLLLALGGGLLGIMVAWWGLSAIRWLAPPPGGAPLGQIALNPRMLGLTLLLTLLTALIFGTVPAIAGSKLDLSGAFRESAPGAGVQRVRLQLRAILVTAQIGLALVLLVGAALLINSFVRLTSRDLNYDAQGLLSFDFHLRLPPNKPLGSYGGFPYYEMPFAPSTQMQRFFDSLRTAPGIESAGGISWPPVNSLILPTAGFRREGVPPPDNASSVYFLVTPGFFATLRTPVLRGRDFNSSDTASSPWVAVVNETAARRFWPGQDPIGKRFTLDVVPEERPREVIGIVRDIPTRSRLLTQDPVIYGLYLQQPLRYRGPFGNMMGQMTFIVRGAGDPMSLAPVARNTVAQFDPDLTVGDLMPMTQRTVEGRSAALLTMLGAFALVATVLAAIGIYGVMSYSVAQRTREIGVRLALGASSAEVLRMLGRRALVLISGGLALGVIGSLAVARLLESQLWGITATDPATFAGVSLVLAMVALLASYLPARRAMRVDPTVALRSE